MSSDSLRHGTHHVVSTVMMVASGSDLVPRPIYVVKEHHEGTCNFPSQVYNSNLGALGEIIRCEVTQETVTPPRSRYEMTGVTS